METTGNRKTISQKWTEVKSREENVRKVLSGEVTVADMSKEKFRELVSALERMYWARVLNCVDPTGKSDKEWTALSEVFRRINTDMLIAEGTSSVPDWLARLQSEHQEACARIIRLKTFLNSNPADISCAAQILLKKQLSVMEEYRDILYVRERLAHGEIALAKGDQV